MSMKQTIFTRLVVEGKERTLAQLAAELDTTEATIAARISDIRHEGYPIYANKRVDTKGRVKTFYRHAKATRKIVAAGYKYLAMLK